MERPVRSIYMDIVDRRALDNGMRRVTIAANEKVRQPPELDFSGLSTENYVRNPVVMWAHDAVGRSPSGGLPIGRTLKLDKTAEGRLVADFEFLDDDSFAQRVKNAWDRGFLRAASISWIPLETVPVDGGRWRDTRSDLLEWSIVSVPADPEALRAAHRRMIDAVLELPPVAISQNPGPAPQSEGAVTGPEPDNRPAEELPTPSRGGLLLTRDRHRDLSAALVLLQGVAEGIQPSITGSGHGVEGRPQEYGHEESDLAVFAAELRSLRRALGAL